MESKIENKSSFESKDQRNNIESLESNRESKVDSSSKPSFFENVKNSVVTSIEQAATRFETAKVYVNADLKPQLINGDLCLIKKDINMDQKDSNGKTNLERMKEGKAPIDANGEKIELHHDKQNSDGILVELSQSEHRGKDNNSTLHTPGQESQIERNKFNTIKEKHWKARAEEFEKSRA
ncbi:MAG: HNH/ENDO VII family nuclease [Peptostreptococcaceae bacterium]